MTSGVAAYLWSLPAYQGRTALQIIDMIRTDAWPRGADTSIRHIWNRFEPDDCKEPGWTRRSLQQQGHLSGLMAGYEYGYEQSKRDSNTPSEDHPSYGRPPDPAAHLNIAVYLWEYRTAYRNEFNDKYDLGWDDYELDRGYRLDELVDTYLQQTQQENINQNVNHPNKDPWAHVPRSIRIRRRQEGQEGQNSTENGGACYRKLLQPPPPPPPRPTLSPSPSPSRTSTPSPPPRDPPGPTGHLTAPKPTTSTPESLPPLLPSRSSDSSTEPERSSSPLQIPTPRPTQEEPVPERSSSPLQIPSPRPPQEEPVPERPSTSPPENPPAAPPTPEEIPPAASQPATPSTSSRGWFPLHPSSSAVPPKPTETSVSRKYRDSRACCRLNIIVQIALASYIHPKTGKELWTRMISYDSKKVTVLVANVMNGPDTVLHNDWKKVIDAAANSGKKVLGYVRTGYLGLSPADPGPFEPFTTRLGSTAIPDWFSQVERDVDKWYYLYGKDKIGGIFFDEAHNECGKNGDNSYAELYRFLSENTKRKYGQQAMTVLNPGTKTQKCYEDRRVFVIIPFSRD
jgi:hypothetical protein